MASLGRTLNTVISSDGLGLDRMGVPRTFDIDAEGLAAFRSQLGSSFEHGDFSDAALDRRENAKSLSTLIESEIIPRLMIAHAGDTPLLPPSGDGAILPGEVEALAPLALQVEADALLMHIEGVLARGVGFDTVMVDLLAPAARMLGEFWESDRCDFVDVTMGLWRLQEVVHEIACRVPIERLHAAGGRRALFASMPGDQHNFGTVVIDELFRRDGWVTDRVSEAETSDLLKRAANDWFDMIGLTISCDCHIGTLPSVIVGLRSVSRNPNVCVMVGGRVFSADPGLAVTVGADGTARDARLALEVARDLVRSSGREAVDCN
jgi:MerR family transcriptional regulator, light-induced transcriptional regulator